MNTNLILSDERFTRSTPGFSASALLDRIDSPRLTDMTSLGDWIDEAADGGGVSRELMCCVAQREQSGLTQRTLSAWALEAFCGYGVYGPGVHPPAEWRGPQDQLAAAAAGLRSLYDQADEVRTEWHATVGQYFAKAQVTPQNRATAALYSYTPTVSDKQTLLGAWEWFGFGDPVATGEPSATPVSIGATIAAVAKRAANAHYAGHEWITINGHKFLLTAKGMCAKFVRQVHEAALGLVDFGWRFASPSAAVMEYHLRASGKSVPTLEPGDIVCFNGDVPAARLNDYAWQKANGNYGHIGLYVGDGKFAESTSSTTRGPGTVLSSLSAMGGRVTGIYRSEYEPVVRNLGIVHPDRAELIDCAPFWKDGQVACLARPLLEGLGFEVGWRRYEDGRDRVYPKRPGVVAAVKSAISPTDNTAA